MDQLQRADYILIVDNYGNGSLRRTVGKPQYFNALASQRVQQARAEA